MKAVISLSGGQDSVTCLYLALSKGLEVEAIGFDYGQSHAKELEAAHNICKNLGVSYKVFNVRGLLADSSLTKHSDHNEKSDVDASLPASFTPGRNILFLAIAASYAAKIGAKQIWTGVCQTDYSGYPDCRREFVDAMQQAVSLGAGAGPLEIVTPLMYLNKAETWKLAKDLGCLDVIINETVTDYDADQTMNAWGKGNESNPASVLRANGYREALAKGWL